MSDWEELDPGHRAVVGIPALVGFAVSMMVWTALLSAVGELYQPGMKMLVAGILASAMGGVPMVLGADISRRWKRNLETSNELGGGNK